MKIRAFAGDDLPSVYAIQARCPQGAQWRREDYLQLARDVGGMILVAEIQGANLMEVAGFAAFHRVMDEAELRNLGVDPLYQRQGIARALLDAGIPALLGFGVRQLFLEVRASNQPAVAFYQAAGFQLLYTRHEYYSDPVEDALVMGSDITPPLSSSSPPNRADEFR